MKDHPTITRIAAAALAVLAVLHIVGLLHFPWRGYDSYCQLFWVGEWHRMWDAGIFYPRWLAGSYRGFGSPSFYFYPPFTFVISSTIFALLPALAAASIAKIEIVLTLAASGITMWLYLRWRLASERSSTIRAASLAIALPTLFYLFAPYRYFDYQIRAALSEHVAFIFVPLVFWGVDMLRRSVTRLALALLVLSFAFLLITNLPTATVTALSIVVYVLASKPRKRSLLSIAGGFFAALLLAAFYLIPIPAWFVDAQLGRLWFKVSMWEASPFTAIFTGASMTIGAYALLMLAGACAALIMWARTKRHLTSGQAAIVGLLVVLQLPFVSALLFTYVPPFTIIQLASRFSSVLVVVIAAAWASELASSTRIERPAMSYITLLWSLGGIAMISLQLSGFHLNKYVPLPIDDAPEYAPRWSRPYYDWGVSLSEPFGSDSVSAIWRNAPQPATFTAERKPYFDTVDYESANDGKILLRRSYWPTWRATLDDHITATVPDSLGRIEVRAPSGRHRLVAWLETSKAAETGSYISIATLVMLAIAAFAFRKKR